MLTNIAHYYYHHSCYYYYYHYCYYNNIYYYHYYYYCFYYFYTILTHTLTLLLLPQSAAEMTESLDIDCAMNLLAKQATEIAQKTGTHPSREYNL